VYCENQRHKDINIPHKCKNKTKIKLPRQVENKISKSKVNMFIEPIIKINKCFQKLRTKKKKFKSLKKVPKLFFSIIL